MPAPWPDAVQRRFGDSLVWRIGALILLALLLFAAGAYRLFLLPALERQAGAQMGQVSEQLQARVHRLLDSVEVTLRSGRAWIAAGELDQDQLARFNEFFFPIIANHREISSVIFAHESGREILLLVEPDGRWVNRLTDPQRWGERAYWISWNRRREVEKVEVRSLGYDARTRPWFHGAMALADAQQVHWTAPYVFFTRQAPGITAAMRWEAGDGGRYVIGLDVLLAELAGFTSGLTVARGGSAALLTDDGRLVAPPRADGEPAQLLLKFTGELAEVPALAQAYRDWRARDRPAGLGRFYAEGEPWYRLFQSFAAGEQRLWLAVLAPQQDFVPQSRRELWLLVAIAATALAMGVLVAVRLARRFARPLARLARESERIGRLDLATPVAPAGPWRELAALAQAQERMRQHLLAATRARDVANAALEQKVAERTAELERSRAALQERESFYRAIFDGAAIGISRLRTDLRRELVNQAFADFVGYPVAQLVAGSSLDLIATEDRERMRAAYTEMAAGRLLQFRAEIALVHADGALRWADVQITPIRDASGAVGGLLATVLDISERRLAQQQLARQLALTRALLDTIPNPIFYKGADSRFLGCNAAYEAAFGIERAALIGKRVLDLAYLPEAARLAYQAEDEAVIASVGQACRETTLRFADGCEHDTLYSVTGFCDPDGSPGGLIGLIVDVSPLKAAERVAEQARAVAEEAAAAKAEFLANMSHEIRTPMNAILGMTHLALQTSLDARQRGYLEKVDGAGRGLLRILNDILDYSKAEAGKMRLERDDFSLEQVLAQVSDLCGLRARDKGLELLFDVAPQLPRWLAGDALRLGQVLVNLVGNAIKFTERGEVTVKLSPAVRSAPGLWLRFEVRDSGIGISAAQQQRLFAAFSQADASTTRRYGGTGLGLSICKRIVELMDGEIGVDSEPGQGSCFWFEARFEPAQHAPSEVAPVRPPAGLSVLVVDDNAAARSLFLQMLTDLGLTAAAVASGAQALAALTEAQARGTPYGLLILDWQMPGLDGVETLRQLRAAERDAESALIVPAIIMTTAYDQEQLADAAAGLTVGAFLPKPVTASTLFDGVARALRRSGQPAPLRAPGREPPPRLDGLRVLLVEDNEVNRELARELLERVGVTVSTAEDGAAAVALARAQPEGHDAILMDCHMPQLDGFAATEQLRADPRLARLPIIAMTAAALSGDRERCLAAGMNDYLTKPVDVAELYAKLAYWCGLPAPSAPPPSVAPAAAHSVPAMLADEAALARLGGDAAMYRSLLTRFADQAAVPQRYREATARADGATAERLIHTLKGLAGTIGAIALEDAASALLQARHDGLPTEAPLAALERALQQSLAAIAARSAPPPDAPAASGAPLAAGLRELSVLLAEDDARAAGCLAALRPALAALLAPERLAALERAVTHYEYDVAQPLVAALAGQLATTDGQDP